MSIKIKTTTDSGNKKRIFPVKDVLKQDGYDWLTESMLRHLLFKSDSYIKDGEIIKGNGLKESGAVIRIGRKILIDLNYFDEWINSQKDLGEVDE
jgi:hypothetical protein